MATSTPVRRPTRHAVLLVALSIGLLPAAACERGGGEAGDKRTDPAELAVSVSGDGPNKYALTAPKTIKSGVVRFTLTNNGRVPHDASIVRVDGDHGLAEVLDILAGGQQGPPIPDWMYGGGGVPSTKPGRSATSIQTLVPGKYFFIDVDGAAKMLRRTPRRVPHPRTSAASRTPHGTSVMGHMLAREEFFS